MLARQVADLLQYVARDVEKVQEFLDGVQNPAAALAAATPGTSSPLPPREPILSDSPCLL